jgi:hypothetical protein
MERRKHLTNEIVTKQFQNQFDLVNYAISVASHIIEYGRAAPANSWTENPALLALDEIETGRDKYEDIEVEEETEVVIEEEVTPKKRSKKAEKALTE